MTIWLLVSLASGLLLQAAAAPTDSRPSFSGTWRLDAGRSESACETASVSEDGAARWAKTAVGAVSARPARLSRKMRRRVIV